MRHAGARVAATRLRRDRGPGLPSAPPQGRAIRGDIQGLRGVAVLLVVVHHAWPTWLPGGFIGVDVFFTLSGFVIGSLLLAEMDRAGTVDLYGFWTRRARRILPASLVVLVATLVATWLWAPVSDRRAIGVDGLWATLFGANLRFIEQGVDYAASERDPSPFQHYWSLAVEEQFYLVIPLVAAAVAVTARRRGRSGRRMLGTWMTLVCVLSLAYSVHLTDVSPTGAYFSPLTRACQLAAGVAAACIAGVVAERGSPRLRDTLGLAGMIALAGTVVLLRETGLDGSGYPSYLSIAPTVATAALLLAGTAAPGLGSRALSFAPLRRVGDVSYSMYLWHWPVLIVASWAVETGPVVNGLLVVLTYALAELTYRLVEDPVRRSSALATRRGLTAAFAICSVGLVAAYAFAVASREARVVVRVDPGLTGPQTAPPRPTARPEAGRITEFAPERSEAPTEPFTMEIDADAVHADYPKVAGLGCQKGYTDGAGLPLARPCTFGAGGRSVYLIGDSMATALSSAVVPAARSLQARVTVMGKASCTLATGVTVHKDEVGGPYRDCARFRENLLDHLEAARPDAVLMVNSNGSSADQVDRHGAMTRRSTWADRTTAGLVDTVTRLREAGIQVILIENPAKPGAGDDGTQCLVNGGTVRKCSFAHRPRVGAYERAHRALDGAVPLVRVNTQVCPDGRCVPVLGDLVVWRDHSHFTASYARTLAPVFARALDHALPGR